MNRYSINYAKGLFFSLGTALVIAVFAEFVYFCITLKGSIEIFLGFLIGAWFLKFMSCWKRIEVEDLQITINRVLRAPVSFSIRENLIAFRYDEHSIYDNTIYFSPLIRIIDKDSNITVVQCPYFTKKTIERLCEDIKRIQY